jgi:hypothetical protein
VLVVVEEEAEEEVEGVEVGVEEDEDGWLVLPV